MAGGITSPKKVTLVNKIIKVKQIIPIKIRQIKQPTALNDGPSFEKKQKNNNKKKKTTKKKTVVSLATFVAL